MRYTHKVIGRVNGRYGMPLREESRESDDGRSMASITDDIAATSHMTFGRVKHRRGNP